MHLACSVRRLSPGLCAWMAIAVLPAVLVYPANAKPPPQPPANTVPAPQAGTPAEKTLNEATLRLFKAVELNDMAAIKSSIEAGADLFAENDLGMTAADLAVDKGHFIIAHYLLSRRMLGKTPPIALLPGTAPETVPDAKPRRKFASPPTKPATPQMAETPPPPPAPESKVPETPKAEAPMAEPPKDEIPPMRITVAPPPIPEPPGKPGEEPSMTEETVAKAAPDDIAPAPVPAEPVEKAEAGEAPTADKPLSEQGVAGFFKALVDLVTPGGEKPPKPVKPVEGPGGPAEGIAEAVPGIPGEGIGEDSFKETIVESTVDSSDEIIVEITDQAGPDDAVEVVEEVTEDTPLALVEDKMETVTAEPQEDAAPAKEEEEKGFLDRMANLFTSDKKEETGKPAAKEPGDTEEKAAGPKGVQVTEYELPLPPPKTAQERKFSPKFLDRLADFLETGDEEAFNAWLPEMQVMNPEALRQPSPPPKDVAVKTIPPVPEGAPAPAPEKSPKPPVEAVAIPGASKPWSTAVVSPSAPPVPGALEASPEAAPKLKASPETGEAVVAEKETAPPPGEATAEKPGMIKGVFNRLVDVLTPDFKSRERPERLILEPEEKLAAADPSKTRDEDGEEASAYWPITEVEARKKPVLALKKPSRQAVFKTSLSGVTLTLGRSVTLENSYPPGQGVDPRNRCVKKNRGTTLFCLETVDWPDTLKPDFLVPTILYTGQKAIARYDQGIASRFHALFPSESFKRIAQYFHERFGEPTDAWNRSIAPFAKPRQDNPTLAWRSIDPPSGVITILEIRKYDDSRGGFPDTKRGAVMLYLANSPPIFPQVSSHELMRLSRGRLAPPPSPGAIPANVPANEPANVPADAPPGDGVRGEAVEEAPEKSIKEMTSEEIQAMRRKKKAKKGAKKGKAPATAPGDVPGEDSFALPPDPKGR